MEQILQTTAVEHKEKVGGNGSHRLWAEGGGTSDSYVHK